MRPLRTHLHSIGRFEDVTLDLTDLKDTARIVAFDGVTGAGKSTLAEAFTGGAMFRNFRNSGPINKMATASDSMLETVIGYSTGTYSIKHLISGKEGGSVLSVEGEAKNKRGKKREFKATVAETFPPELLLYNTVWREQKALGFLELEQVQRRELILLATNANKWEVWAAEARARETTAQAECTRLRTTIDALKGQLDLDELSRADEVVVAHQLDVHTKQSVWNDVAELLERAQAKHVEYAQAEREHQLHLDKQRELRNRAAHMATQLKVLNERKLQLCKLLADGPEIRSAAFAIAVNDKLIGELSETLQLDTAKLAQEQINMAELEGNQRSAGDTMTELHRVTRLRADVDSARATLAGIEEACSAIDKERDIAAMAVRTYQGTQLADKDERIGKLRDALVLIRDDACNIESACLIATRGIETDDGLLKQAQETPGLLADAELNLAAQVKRFADASNALADTKARAARFDEVTEAEEKFAAVQIALLEIIRTASIVASRIDVLVASKVAIESEILKVKQSNASLKVVADALDNLNRAEATIAELDPQIASCGLGVQNLELELAALGEPVAPEPPPDTSELKLACARAKNDHVAACSALAVTEERFRRARATLERAASLQGELSGSEWQAAQWKKLAADLGRDGIQASLVDAAGPELTETANYLLHTCFGDRWSIQVSTQRDSADGKKRIEECEIRVIDNGCAETNDPPREGEGKTFSGGQQEILSLAFQLALTYLSRNCGIVNPDLFFDEPASTLDEDMRARWVKMLRTAADLIGCKHIYVITHNEDIKALADARIVVANGQARIVQ